MKTLNNKGFTLIELLIVIAVLGILAAVVLVAINPLEQLARGRDAGRKNSMGQISNALQAYYTNHAVSRPAQPWPLVSDGPWVSQIVATGELKQVPAGPAYGGTIQPCIAAAENTFCYATDDTEAIAYVRLESQNELQKCAAGLVPYFLWSSNDAQAGTVCSAAEPTAITGATPLYPYQP